MNEADLEILREALRQSPDNLPLRRHLAELLVRSGRPEEAIDVFKEVLRQDPADVQARLGLARCFYRAGRFGEAMVLVETLCEEAEPPAVAEILRARLLRRDGRIEEAVAAYRRGVTIDAAVADEELADQLGVDTPVDSAESVVDGRVRHADGVGGTVAAELERPAIDFSAVGGMQDLKEQIRMKIIHPLTNPDLYAAYGKKIGGGILLYGPPGCGKTHLARAVAGEIDARFLSIGISDVLDMWIGASERNLHELFEQARRHRPCVLFVDEVDALAASRSDMRQSAGRQVINQFLAELDGVEADNDGLLILAATNAPWHVDAAFRRPGRFDRIIFVPPPDRAARAEILRIHLHGKPTEDLDLDVLAKKSDGFSGADLKAVVDLAIEGALEEAMRSGRVVPLKNKVLLKAVKQQRCTTREWFASARNHALYANQGGLYDEVLDYLGIKR